DLLHRAVDQMLEAVDRRHVAVQDVELVKIDDCPLRKRSGLVQKDIRENMALGKSVTAPRIEAQIPAERNGVIVAGAVAEDAQSLAPAVSAGEGNAVEIIVIPEHVLHR